MCPKRHYFEQILQVLQVSAQSMYIRNQKSYKSLPRSGHSCLFTAVLSTPFYHVTHGPSTRWALFFCARKQHVESARANHQVSDNANIMTTLPRVNCLPPFGSARFRAYRRRYCRAVARRWFLVHSLNRVRFRR